MYCIPTCNCNHFSNTMIYNYFQMYTIKSAKNNNRLTFTINISNGTFFNHSKYIDQLML
jgi:hypothetical protein